MKITEVRLGLISVPLRVPFKTALRSVSSVEDVIVEIHTDTGAVGYGEAPPTGVITGDTTGAIIGAIRDHIAKTIIGRDVDDFEDLMIALNACIQKNTSAKAAVDMALWDLYGQLYKIPVYKLMGGAKKSIVTDITISVNDPEEMVRDALNSAMPFLDKATWTVLLITLSGLIGAVTPVGRMAGSTELSNLLLYSVVALLASRASFLELTDAPAWILAGFMILAIHGIILVLLAKIFHLDMFTCGVASLANIGGSASAPILAGAYSGALVPVGVLMALMGYVIGTAGGLITANIMALLA